MPSVYPGALPPAGSASSTDTLAAAGHTSLHNTDRDGILAVATKLGTGSSTATGGTVLRGTGAGTSAWGQVVLTTDVTGILPVANGGTGQSTQTGTGLPVAQTSPTIITPTIASFANAQHDHTNAAGGGQLSTGALADGSVTPAKWTNPYCFRAYASGATTLTDATPVKVLFATEEYDYNSNFASSTYTAPVAGVYHFSASLVSTAISTPVTANIRIYKNGSPALYAPAGDNAAGYVANISGDLLLAASDTIEVYFYQDSAGAETSETGSDLTWFAGHLVRKTP